MFIRQLLNFFSVIAQNTQNAGIWNGPCIFINWLMSEHQVSENWIWYLAIDTIFRLHETMFSDTFNWLCLIDYFLSDWTNVCPWLKSPASQLANPKEIVWLVKCLSHNVWVNRPDIFCIEKSNNKPMLRFAVEEIWIQTWWLRTVVVRSYKQSSE